MVSEVDRITVLVSDNGPQYACREMKEFSGFHPITNSPHYPQSNGQAVKQLLEHSADRYMTLLSYRATPLPDCEKDYGSNSFI